MAKKQTFRLWLPDGPVIERVALWCGQEPGEVISRGVVCYEARPCNSCRSGFHSLCGLGESCSILPLEV